MNLDVDKFIANYRGIAKLSDKAEPNLKILLAFMKADKDIRFVEDAAYMLATVKWECANTYEPIEEFGKGKGRAYGRTCDNGKVFYGRGYVQLTWDHNYKRIGKLLGVDLYNNPHLALHYDIAYQLLSKGMRKGWFTGVGLSKYIKDGAPNYKSARRIINGLDCAEKIAEQARLIEGVLRKSTV